MENCMSTASATLEFLLEKYGVALPFEEAATVLRYPSLIAARSARQRGTFPVPIRRAGDRHLCAAADIAAFLDGATIPLHLPTAKPKRGRPTKAEQIARQRNLETTARA
jgi:hypothetical protein